MKAAALHRIVICIALALACASLAADAADKQQDRSANKALQQDPRAKDKVDKPQPAADGLDVCKQQAHGMEGPERARFMTQCLKRN